MSATIVEVPLGGFEFIDDPHPESKRRGNKMLLLRGITPEMQAWLTERARLADCAPAGEVLVILMVEMGSDQRSGSRWWRRFV